VRAAAENEPRRRRCSRRRRRRRRVDQEDIAIYLLILHRPHCGPQGPYRLAGQAPSFN